MTKPPTKAKTRNYRQRAGDRPGAKQERRTTSITFRTLKGLAERLAQSEARSLGNFLEHLIRRECQRSLVFADERAAATTFKSDPLAAG